MSLQNIYFEDSNRILFEDSNRDQEGLVEQRAGLVEQRAPHVPSANLEECDEEIKMYY